MNTGRMLILVTWVGVALLASGCGDERVTVTASGPSIALERFLSSYGPSDFEDACAVLKPSISVVIGINRRGNAPAPEAPASCTELLTRIFNVDARRARWLTSLNIDQVTLVSSNRAQLVTAVGEWSVDCEGDVWRVASIDPLVSDQPVSAERALERRGEP